MAEALSRGLEYVQSALVVNVDPEMRFGALDRARGCLVEARRARVPPDHMYPLLHAILNAAVADTNQHARVLIGQVCEDLCMRDLKSFAISCTPFLNRALGDTHVLVVKRAIRTLTALFRRVMGLAVSLGIGMGEQGFPQETFDCWTDMEKRAVAMMNSKDIGVQKAATKFAETVVLALSYSDGRPTPDHFTLDYAVARRLSPALLQEFEAEGHRVISSVAGFIYSSFGIKAPAGIPHIVPTVKVSPASLVTAFSVIGNLLKRREKSLRLTLPALLLAVRAITGAGGASTENFKKFPEGQRWCLIKLIKHTLKACMGYAHINSNSEITNALTDIRKIDESLKQENYSKLHRQPTAKRESSRAGATHVTSDPTVAGTATGGSMKRPRVAPPAAKRTLEWVPPAIAWDHVQYYVSTMPADEVPHFVMTRLILDTPPHPSELPRTAPSVPVAPAEQDIQLRAQKRLRHEKTEAQVVLRETPRKPVRRYAPPVVALQLDESGIQKLMHLTCKSILGRETIAKASGAAELRRLVLARQLAQVSLAENELQSETGQKLCKEAVAFIAEDMGKRRELALAWLHAVLYADAATVEPEIEKESNGKLTLKMIQNGTDAPARPARTPSPTPEADIKKYVKEENVEMNANANDNENKNVDAEGNVAMEDAKDVPVKNAGALIDGANKNIDGNNDNNTTDVNEKGNKMDETSGGEDTGDTKEAEANGGDVEERAVIANGTTEGGLQAVLDAVMADESRSQEIEVTEATAQNCAVYEQLLGEILQRILVPDGGHVNHDTYAIARRFIMDTPVIPASVMDLLRHASRDIEKNEFALETLRDIVLERYGADRKDALDILLSLAIDNDTVIRGPTIRLVAETLYNDLPVDVSTHIEAFTFDGLDNVIETIVVNADAASTPLLLSELEQRSWLACALVSQKQSLLHRFAKSYTKASGAARELLHGRAKSLSGQLGSESTEMVQLIESDSGAPDFALAILVGVASKYGRPSPTLVDAACRRFEMCGDARFLEAILPGMSKELLQKYLGDLVKWAASEIQVNENASSVKADIEEAAAMCKPFSKMFRTIMESQPPALGATDLLVALHALDADSSSTKAAIRSCFELKAIFKYPVIAQALQQLVALTPIPGHLMRTVLLTRAFHEDVDEYLSESIVDPLIRKKVWTKSHHKNLYTDLLEYCVLLKERSMKILLRLPETQLDAALKRRNELIENFRPVEGNNKALKKIPAKKRKIIATALTKNKADD